VIEAVRRMIFNVRSGNADDHGKNHSFILNEDARTWSLAPAYDLTLNFSASHEYSGLFPNTFGRSPQLSSLISVAADAGISRDEFDEIDTQVVAAIKAWPQFASAAGVPREDTEQAKTCMQVWRQPWRQLHLFGLASERDSGDRRPFHQEGAGALTEIRASARRRRYAIVKALR